VNEGDVMQQPGRTTSNPRVAYELSTGRAPLQPLNGRPLLVQVVVNIEHWPFERPVPRAVLPSPHGGRPAPDVPNVSWAEYGMRCGLPRIMEALADRDLPATVSCNAGAVDAYPQAVDALAEAGYEFMAHGLQQQTLHDADDEQAVITRALELLEERTGTRPRGWLGPGLQETLDTPDHLAAAGVGYVCDWVHDDLPTTMATRHGELVAVPYTLELNDSVVFAVEHHTAEEYERRLRATLETFDRELPTSPRVLTIALHPHLIGAPHRIGTLTRMLDRLLARDDQIFVTGGQTMDWYLEQQPPASPAVP
jgi:allantoinase